MSSPSLSIAPRRSHYFCGSSAALCGSSAALGGSPLGREGGPDASSRAPLWLLSSCSLSLQLSQTQSLREHVSLVTDC